MEFETVKIITISELLQRSRPLTGTSSLHSHPNRPIPSPLHKSQPSIPTAQNPNPNPRTLSPLTHPTLLIGTLTLPLPTHNHNHNNCFVFSDESSSICCDILDFDARVIGKKIRVFSWNFIPFKRGVSGFLEVIKWGFVDSACVIGRCSSFDSFPLVLACSTACNDSSKARYCFHCALESVSPVSVVPCSSGSSGSLPKNIRGFLVKIVACECKLCKSKDLVVGVNDWVVKGESGHSFTKLVTVYFCGSASSWHPVISKLIGNVVSISGLKKKLVFIGKEESQLMYVTTEKAFLHVPRSRNRWVPRRKSGIKGNGEVGAYTGVVNGVYLQGMVVELDKEVWLLLTDQLLTPVHGLRVGALISVRNVHFVNPKFSWGKMLILGACCRTSISVESFSPFETEYHMVSQSQSLLGKFIESLVFSARLWVLLLVASFKKKFTGILSEKEILGSKHKEGLVQKFASSHLPSSVFRSRDGVFMELCKHDSCSCGDEPNNVHLKLVVPISYFFCHCEATWKKSLPYLEKECEIMSNNKQFRRLSCEGRHYCRSIRKVFSSEDIGVVLLGRLEISPSSGRLQMVDATGSIDIVIPDLPSSWNVHSIYEVNDYSVVIEGVPGLVDHLGLLCNESFSCRSIFDSFPLAREMNLAIFVYFHLQNATRRNLLFHPCTEWKDDFEDLDGGTFHLLLITHKFPMLQKFQSDPVNSNRSSMFAEATVLPWDLFLAGNEGIYPATVSEDVMENFMEHHGGRNNQERVPCKRHRIDCASSKDECEPQDGYSNLCCKCFNLSSPLDIPCLVTIRSAGNHNLVRSGFLYCRKANVKAGIGRKPNLLKVLLEFKLESFFKYQLLQIGGYYITRHLKEDFICNLKDSAYVSGGKVLITSRTRLWSLRLSSDEPPSCTESSCHSSLIESSINYNEVFSRDLHEIELLQRSAGKCSEVNFDVDLHLSTDVKSLLEVDGKVLEEGLTKPAMTPKEAANSSLCLETPLTTSVQLSGAAESNCLLPEGNLISLHGHVVEIHSLDCSPLDACLSTEIVGDIHQLRCVQGVRSRVCIHVSMDRHIVRILGTLSKHAYPTGFGPGVTATFHRILQSSGRKDFMLMPVSYIVINSITTVVNKNYSDECSDLCSTSNQYDVASLGAISSGLISELIQRSDCKPMQFHCRVVAIHVLVLERRNRKYDDPLSKIHAKPPVNIPLAGFVLDDGSSPCCCWANAEQATTLLRLHEEIPQNGFGSSCWMSKGTELDNSCISAIHHVDRILKKHGRVTVKNYGSVFDSAGQDLTFFVNSDNVFNSSDENLLKFIILNACFGTIWTVLGSMMDSDSVGQLERYLTEMEMTMHSMHNIWAREVFYANPLTEARNVIQELLNG